MRVIGKKLMMIHSKKPTKIDTLNLGQDDDRLLTTAIGNDNTIIAIEQYANHQIGFITTLLFKMYFNTSKFQISFNNKIERRRKVKN